LCRRYGTDRDWSVESGLSGDCLKKFIEGRRGDYGSIAKVFEFLGREREIVSEVGCGLYWRNSQL
jgi:hypothetical protein